MFDNHFLLRCSAVVLALCAASPASASQLPVFSFYGGVDILADDGSGGLTTTDKPSFTGSQTATVASGGGAITAQIQAATLPSPSISAFTRNGIAGLTNYTAAVNNLDYYIRIVGPDASNVLLSVDSRASLSSSNLVYGSGSSFLLGVGSQTIANVGSSTSGLTVLGGSASISGAANALSITQTLSEQSNTDILVHMYVAADVQGNSLESAGAFLDPIFSIDPSFAGANKYSIETSLGIGNGSATSATPLPSTWGMMLLGLGVLGFMGYRRRSSIMLPDRLPVLN